MIDKTVYNVIILCSEFYFFELCLPFYLMIHLTLKTVLIPGNVESMQQCLLNALKLTDARGNQKSMMPTNPMMTC